MAESSFQFKGWSGDSTSTENPLTITVDGDLSFTPIFQQDRANPMYTWIQVDAEAVEGKGTLSISPAPLSSFYEYDTPGHVSSTWYRYSRSTLSQATVSFTPASGTTWSVREWRYTVGLPPGAEQVSTSATVSVPLDQEAHVRPVLGYRLTVNIEGDGAVHFGDPGTVYDTSPVVMDFPASQAVSVYAVPDAGSALVSWMGDATGTANPLPLTMNADKNITAVFSTAFDAGDVNLNVTVLGEGEIRVNAVPVTDSQRFVFDDNTQVQLEAVPAAGYDFIGWGGHLTGTATPQNLLLDTSKSVSALFVPTGTTPEPRNSIHVIVEGNGDVLPGSSHVEPGGPSFLVAKPQFGWRFVHWIIDGDVVEGNVLGRIFPDDETLSAIFEPGFSVVTEVDESHGVVYFGNIGEVLPQDPELWNAGYRLDGSDMATVTAVAAPGYRFSHWEGDLSGTNATAAFAVTSNMVIKPVFVEVHSYRILTIGDGVTSATINGVALPSSGNVIHGMADDGTHIVLTATPPDGYYLDHWSGNVVRTGLNTAVVSLTSTSEVRAYFAAYPIKLEVDIEHPEWGSVQVEPVKEEYFPGDVVQITPMQTEGSSFVGFEAEPGVDGYVALQQLPLVARLTGDTHITAKFGRDVAVQAFVQGEGTVEITPQPQQAGRLECSAGTEVTLTAVPAEDWVFVRWEGDVSSSDVSLQLTASEDVIVQAVFEEEATVRYAYLTFAPSEHVTVRPESASRSIDPWWNGQHSVTDRFLSGSIISISASKSGVSGDDNPSGRPAADYFWRGYINGFEGPTYMGWLGWWESGAKVLVPRWQSFGGGGSMWMGHFGSEPGQPVATSNFPVSSVTVGIEGRGMVVGGRGGGPFVFPKDKGVSFARTHAEEFALCMARPLDGWQFQRWEHSSSNIQAGMDIARIYFKGQSAQSESLTAVFVPALPVELDIEKVGEGQVSPEAGHHTLGQGDLVILEATPADGWLFDRWECDGCAFVSTRLRAGLIIEEDMSIRAVFKQQRKLLTHAEGHGHVHRSPQGVFYAQTDSVPPTPAVVGLEAMAEPGWEFVEWSGDASGTSANVSMEMSSDREVTAVFREVCSCNCEMPGVKGLAGAKDAGGEDVSCEEQCAEACDTECTVAFDRDTVFVPWGKPFAYDVSRRLVASPPNTCSAKLNWAASGSGTMESSGIYGFSSNGGETATVTAQCPVHSLSGDSLILHVVELTGIQVSEAYPEIGHDGHYVTALQSPEPTLTALLTPAASAENLPADFISWSGGIAGADQLMRQVYTGSPSNVEVTVACGPSQSVTIHVADATVPPPNTPADLRNTIGESIPEEDFPDWPRAIGVAWTSRFRCGDPKLDYSSYLDGNAWIFRLNSASHLCRTGIRDLGKTDITSETDDDITVYNFGVVVSDLTPVPVTGTQHGPPREYYWCPDITQAHEDFHVDDFHDGFWVTYIGFFEQWLETNPINRIPFDCSNEAARTAVGIHDSSSGAIQNEINDQHEAADDAFYGLGPPMIAAEIRAHDVSNTLYDQRSRAIDNRYNHPTATISGPTSVSVNLEATFTVVVTPTGGNYHWLGGGTPNDGHGNTFTTEWSTPGTKSVNLTYEIPGATNSAFDHITVDVIP